MEGKVPPMTTVAHVDLPSILLSIPNPADVPWIATPWRTGGHVYAADGRRIARVPESVVSPEVLATIRDGSVKPEAPDAAGFWSSWIAGCEGGPIVPTPAGYSEKVPCDDCGGDGLSICSECGHQGDCGTCKGIGMVLDPEPVELAPGYRFKTGYLGWLVRHGVVELRLPARPPTSPDTSTLKPAMFVTPDEVEGFVCPVYR
jgi:hypothetical protein